jgi:photosystem II stability/assembly factor-like uncharacterized protein
MKKNYLLLILSFLYLNVTAQKKSVQQTISAVYDTSLFNNMHWRNIGPFRGGRSLAVCGISSQPNIYYAGAVGGGLWKTSDGGQEWNCISDSAFHSSSVGAVTVAPSDPNIIYVGMGEAEMRGNISFGDGIYKSADAGKSWKHIGLKNSYAISTILVHPQNPDLVYACVMGKTYGPNAERGLYRSKDGGKVWERILYKNDSTGCVSVAIDPGNPRTMYATLWQAYRNRFSLSSGGKGCGLYKSMDGGDTWIDISQYPGLPVGLLGKITVCTSAAKPERVYASVENENGGIFKSDDRGEHWTRTTDDRNLRKRPWYFSTIVADQQNADVIYCLNVQFWKSTDAGAKFNQLNNPHGDNHDMWIDPANPKRFILGDDGGPWVTNDGGITYTEADLPTAQFYHVNLDNDFPYHVYGAQQDNSSIRISSGTNGNSIGKEDWFRVAGGEAGYIVPDPKNSDITFGGEYAGYLSMYNKKTDQYKYINVYPEIVYGAGAESKKYRFNWTYPISFSPHSAEILYVCSQSVHRSMNRGESWETISPDLTRHDSLTMKPSGGPITKDNTGAEVYADVFTFAESPVKPGILWAGSDDGLIHVSKDNGKTWINVTPKIIPEWGMISIIDASPFDEATAYVAMTRYKSDDTKPYLLKTNNYGVTWKLITNGIRENDFTRVIREDPNKKGMLVCGTETGVYISFNDGEKWQPLQLNLPNTPVHDMQFQKREKDLVIATHGRSFWILDDVSTLYQLADAAQSKYFLYQPRNTVRWQGNSYYNAGMQEGENAPHGALLRYYLAQKPDAELTIKFFNSVGDTIITYSSTKDKNGEPVKISKEFYQDKKLKRPGILSADIGMNTFIWDLRYPDAKNIEEGNKAKLDGGVIGTLASPGKYLAKLYLKDSLLAERSFQITKDPRIDASDADLQAQFDLMQKINRKLSAVHEGVNKIRKLRKQVNLPLESVKDSTLAKEIKKITQPFLDSLKNVEEELTQPKAVTDYDLFNFPNKLDDKIAGLASIVSAADSKPTQPMYDVFNELSTHADVQLSRLSAILIKQLPAVNKIIEDKKLYLINGEKK